MWPGSSRSTLPLSRLRQRGDVAAQDPRKVDSVALFGEVTRNGMPVALGLADERKALMRAPAGCATKFQQSIHHYNFRATMPLGRMSVSPTSCAAGALA